MRLQWQCPCSIWVRVATGLVWDEEDSLEGYPTGDDSLERLSYTRLSYEGIPSGMLATQIVSWLVMLGSL
ncbi:MAG: hypothetical protein WCI02_10405 [Planctomycetota bacterium]|jgi:hypothetical protein